MNKVKLEKRVLLEQSGELSPRQQRRLNGCPEAQAVRDELNAFFSTVQEFDTEPSPWAVPRINARLQKERRSILLPIRVWQPILALAACLTLVVTTLDFMSGTSSESTASITVVEDVWNVQFEEDLAELESLILAISGDPLDITEM